MVKLLLSLLAGLLCMAQAHADRPKAAIIGGGGSGLTTAWLIEQDYEVTLFEVQDRLGGHANTIEVQQGDKKIPIEAGFEFISKKQFPHFYHLLKNILEVPLHAYTLTTSFYRTDSNDAIILPPFHDGVIEWESLSAHDIVTMVQLDHLLDKAKVIIDTKNDAITLQNFLNLLGLSSHFKEEFLYPFIGAGWGVSKDDIKQFAAYDALKYVVEGKKEEHYQWIEIVDGTKKYIQALADQLDATTVKLNSKITSIFYGNGIYTIVTEDGSSDQFEHLIFATNAMEAKRLLQDISETAHLRAVLENIRYFKTTIAIHGDPRFMPPDHDDWRVVNVRYDGHHSASTIYKKWLSKKPIFKSWLTFDVRPEGDIGSPMPEPLYDLVHYDHPIADINYFQAQKALKMMQGVNCLWFAGNYTHDNDSHESAIISAMNVAKRLAPHSTRLQLLEND